MVPESKEMPTNNKGVSKHTVAYSKSFPNIKYEIIWAIKLETSV